MSNTRVIWDKTMARLDCKFTDSMLIKKLRIVAGRSTPDQTLLGLNPD